MANDTETTNAETGAATNAIDTAAATAPNSTSTTGAPASASAAALSGDVATETHESAIERVESEFHNWYEDGERDAKAILTWFKTKL